MHSLLMTKPSIQDLTTYLFLEDSNDLPDSSDECEVWVARAMIATGIAEKMNITETEKEILDAYMVPDFLVHARDEDKTILLNWLVVN